MKERTLQILKYLAIPCLFSCLGLSADDYGDSSGKNSMKSSQDKGHFVSTYERLKGQEVTPEAGVVVSGGVDVYVTADYIYWHASEGGLAYAYSSGIVSTLATSNNAPSQGRLVSPQFKMSSGFKVGLGLDFHYDGWDMELMYTWLRPKASSSFDAADAGEQNQAVWSTAVTAKASTKQNAQVYISPAAPTSGSSSWKLHVNVLDLELGRAFFVSPKLVVRPHFGLKGTWDTQTYNVNYVAAAGGVYTASSTASSTTKSSGSSSTTTSSAGALGLVSSATADNYTIARKQNYWGVGPRTGVNSCWMISRNFSVFSDWAFATLWGQFKNTRTDTSNLTGDTTVTDFVPVYERGRLHQLNAVLEMELGLRYDYWFSDDEYRFRIGASWENQLWFNQNHFLGVHSDFVNGDLSLQGLTLNLRFDF